MHRLGAVFALLVPGASALSRVDALRHYLAALRLNLDAADHAMAGDDAGWLWWDHPLWGTLAAISDLSDDALKLAPRLTHGYGDYAFEDEPCDDEWIWVDDVSDWDDDDAVSDDGGLDVRTAYVWDDWMEDDWGPGLDDDADTVAGGRVTSTAVPPDEYADLRVRDGLWDTYDRILEEWASVGAYRAVQ